VLTILAILAVAYILLMAVFLTLERNLIFMPDMPGRLSGNWQPAGLPVEDVWLTAEDGVRVHAWWIPGPQASITVLAFHGNAANLPNRAEIYAQFRSLPANVLAVEYRGYGKSEGEPSEEGIYRDARAALAYLTGPRGLPAQRIIVYGASLGSAVAADAAVNRPAGEDVGGVVLEAPFPSVAYVAKRIYFFLPGLGTLARTQLDTAGKVAKLRVPLLIMHCTDDPVIPFTFGVEVFRRAAGPWRRFYPIKGRCHEGASLEAPEEFLREMRGLVARVVSAPDATN
jgi:hypothetical protein